MPPEPLTDDRPGAAAGRPRLFLHLGLPKSGTTSLQEVMEHHRDVLAEDGLCHPDAGEEGHYLAALEMTGKHERWGFTRAHVAGRFAHLLELGRAAGGDVVISHEIFGQALPDQVPMIVEAADDFELHLVITARDIGRVLAASWQESVKNGKKSSFDRFVERKARKLPGGPESEAVFWRYQNIAEVLRRWTPHVPAERIHLVVCPPVGAPRDALWRRFAQALDFPADVVDVAAVPRANESLGVAQVAFLRRVNQALGGRLEEPWGDRIRKHWFAQEVLAATPGEKAVTPVEIVERFAPAVEEWIEAVQSSGCRVHGDLADLAPRPVPGAAEAPHPDDVTLQAQFEPLPQVVAEMLLHVRDLEDELEQARSWSHWWRRPFLTVKVLPERLRERRRRSAAAE